MRTYRLRAVCTFLALFLVSPLRAEQSADEAALRALNRAYAEKWEKQDADALMALFTPDVTVVPHHGAAPIEGREALRAFWFPEDAPPTVVPEYDLTPSEIIVAGNVGIVRGRFRLTFEYNGTRTTIPRGNYVHISKRTGDGWKLRLITWNDDPRDWVQNRLE